MLHRLLSSESRTITAGAMILIASGLLSRILGLVRDRVFASMFGAGDVLDAYYAAFRIPDFLFSVLIIGALSASFVPVFVKERGESVEMGWNLVNNVLGFFMLSLVAVGSVMTFFTPALLDVVAPGFFGSNRDLAISLSRIMMISPVLLGLSSIFSSVLQSLNRFISYALAPVLYNVGIILGALLLVPIMGRSGLAWGVVLGAVLHLVIQIPALRDTSFTFKPFLRPISVGTREILRLMIPRTIGIAANQVNLVVVTAIASLLAAGSITVFNFANNLHFVPIGAIGVPFAIAAFPRLSKAFAQQERETFSNSLMSTLREILYWVIPITALFVVLRSQIVHVVLGFGAFSLEAMQLTSVALALFSVSMVAQAVIPLLARAFYAQHNTKTPVVVSIISMMINVVAAILLVQWIGGSGNHIFRSLFSLKEIDGIAVLGLPIAFSIAGLVNVLLLALFLQRRGLWNRRAVSSMIARIILSAALASVMSWWLLRLTHDAIDVNTFFGVLVQGMVSGIGGLSIYWVATRMFRIPESSLHRLRSMMRS